MSFIAADTCVGNRRFGLEISLEIFGSALTPGRTDPNEDTRMGPGCGHSLGIAEALSRF
jgi:hypothetical protein